MGCRPKYLLSGGVWAKACPDQRGLARTPSPQVLCLQLQASQVEVARLRGQLSERQQELRASRRLLQEQMQEWEDLLNTLEVQRQEAQRYRAARELLGRCLVGRAGRAVPAWGGGSSPRPSMWEGAGHVSQTETASGQATCPHPSPLASGHSSPRQQ